jgi:hypothetical protein
MMMFLTIMNAKQIKLKGLDQILFANEGNATSDAKLATET